jgi:hypothetical protein
MTRILVTKRFFGESLRRWFIGLDGLGSPIGEYMDDQIGVGGIVGF